MTQPHPRKLKRVIIREEYVALTGTYVRAVLLHQLEYRQKCAYDVDSFVAEESQRLAQEGIEGNISPANGWFYKKAAELATETMLELDETTIRRHIKFFIGRGWIDERRNPKRKWDRTMQYRLNLVKIKADLEAIGYQLEGWVFDEPVSRLNSTTGNLQLGSGIVQDGSGNSPDRRGDMQLRSCNLQEQYKNTSYKHIPQHIHNTLETEACVSGSGFSPEEIHRYVEDCAQSGQQIRGGLAVWLQETGKGDHLITTFLEREKKTNKAGQAKLLHPHECPRCYGSQMEVVPNKGARPCTYSERNNFSGGNIPRPQQQHAEI